MENCCPNGSSFSILFSPIKETNDSQASKNHTRATAPPCAYPVVKL